MVSTFGFPIKFPFYGTQWPPPFPHPPLTNPPNSVPRQIFEKLEDKLLTWRCTQFIIPTSGKLQIVIPTLGKLQIVIYMTENSLKNNVVVVVVI